MAKLTQYNYVFAIGTFFALLDAYNNGASKYTPECFKFKFDTNNLETMSPTRGLLQSRLVLSPTVRP
jgi:hypothetical protein